MMLCRLALWERMNSQTQSQGLDMSVTGSIDRNDGLILWKASST